MPLLNLSLILPYHLHLGLSKRFLSFSFRTKALNVVPLVPYTASCAANRILLHL